MGGGGGGRDGCGAAPAVDVVQPVVPSVNITPTVIIIIISLDSYLSSCNLLHRCHENK